LESLCRVHVQELEEKQKMKLSLSKSTRILVLGAMVGGTPLLGFTQQQPAPDNTKANAQVDQNTAADKQSNAASDRALTQQVRKAITQDKAMSTYAHNVKVVAQNGQVTLSGPVRSDDEKQAIVQKAAEVAGQDHIVDQISVAPKQQ
jgi:osmotically-inducible protein OsmY